MLRIVIGILLVLFAQEAFSQVEMRMDNSAAKGEPGDTVNVILFASRARDITNFSFPVSFNTDALTYVESVNAFDTELIVDEAELASGQIGISWDDQTLMGLSSFRQEFVELRFVITTDCRVKTPIAYTGDVVLASTMEVNDNGDIVPISTTYYDGEVKTECVRGVFDVSDVIIGEVATVDVPFYIEDLEQIIGLDFKLNFDASKLEFVGMSDPYFSSGVSFNAVGNEIIYFWNDPDLTPRDALDRSALGTFNFINKMDCGEVADIIITESSIAAAIGIDIHSEVPTNIDGGVSVSCTPIIAPVITNVDCFGASTGSIILNVSSGVAPYEYEWSRGDLTKDIFNVMAGTYSVTVTDANNQEGIFENIVVTQNDEIEGVVSMEGDCESGEVTVSLAVTGGDGPYEIMWNSGDQGSPIVVSNLPAILSVVITDNLMCTKEYNNIEVDALENINLSVETNRVTCFGEADGSIVLTVGGGAPDYTYTWVGPNGFEADTKDISGLVSGMYSVRVEDQNGCSSILTEEVQGPTSRMTLSVVTENASGGDNGRATVIVDGGMEPYEYSWSCTNQTLPIVDGLAAGNCCVTVTDAFDCENEECFEILVGTNEIEGVISYSIFPNPTFDRLNIEIEMDQSENLRLEIVNSLGQVVYQGNKSNAKFVNENINTELWPQGSYTLKVFNDSNKSLTQGIIKM